MQFGRETAGFGIAPGEGMYAGDGGVREESGEDVGALGVLACYVMLRGAKGKRRDRRKQSKEKKRHTTRPVLPAIDAEAMISSILSVFFLILK